MQRIEGSLPLWKAMYFFVFADSCRWQGKKGAILAGLWPCFRWQQLLPAFPRAAGRTIRFCAFPSSVTRVRSSRRRANLPTW
jgi:hypothetical protein